MRTIIGYSNYMVSKNGDIFNLEGKKMAHTIDRDGYHRVGLVSNDGIRRQLGIHRIVYGTYNDIEISNIGIIDHIDMKRDNNDISNLREISWSKSNVNKKTRKVYIALDILNQKVYQFDNLDLAKEHIGIDNYKPKDKINISKYHIILVRELESIDDISYFKEIDYSFENISNEVICDIDMTKQKYKQICPKIAKNAKTGKTYIYRNNTEFATFLEGTLSGVQGALLKNVKTYKGYSIEYLPFFYNTSLNISEVISTTTLKWGTLQANGNGNTGHESEDIVSTS